MASPKLRWLLGVWLVGLLAGFNLLWNYAATPGTSAVHAIRWPASLGPLTRPTLLVLAHPRCPCTRATLAELAVIMERAGSRLAAHVLFVQPAGSRLESSDLQTQAAAIHGVVLHRDNGETASSVGAQTSGQTMLFDAAGKLVFAGGITGARGHEGENEGRDAVLRFVERMKPAPTAPVFGCALFDPAQPGGKDDTATVECLRTGGKASFGRPGQCPAAGCRGSRPPAL